MAGKKKENKKKKKEEERESSRKHFTISRGCEGEHQTTRDFYIRALIYFYIVEDKRVDPLTPTRFPSIGLPVSR